MFALIGYKNLSLIHESTNSEVYRGLRESDNQSVVLKILKQNYGKPSKLTKYKQEFEILSSLDTEGVIKAHSLENYQRTAIIILEDFAADSLKKRLVETQFSLKEFLNIALLIVNSLGNIHDRNIIHKDINPANLLFNPKTGELKIIDFGIATALTQENPSLKNINILEGTLAYISPEQTGRMNCSLDYRTDYYSLGVTFYELLTQQLPFTNQDPLELIHCHLAKQPLTPHQIDSKIPPILSEIVMKLMAKTAESRYQSSYGIRVDLQECLRQLTLSGNIQEFPLATQDIISKFKIPQKLYGRDAEITHLLASFNRISQLSNQDSETTATSELTLIDGYSGVGKTALVKEIYKPLSEKRGYFISGKFDQLQRNIPYSAIVSAFSELIQQLLSENIAQLEQWRHKLLNNLGINAQIMIEVIPELELIIGQQPETSILGSIESQNRFNLVFQSLVTAFCDPEHPLVIFLDDLQWADIASLKFIELILSQQNTQHLLLIGAYRNNEVSETHPLMEIIENLNQSKVKINRINLKPLEVTSVTQLIADTLHRDRQSVMPLAELVFSKTHGNPFFVNQFLKTLHRENLLVFQTPQSSSQKVGWQWDIDQITALNITDNVVELTLAQLKKLPPATQNLLLIAAAIGSEFSLKTLSIICERPAPEIFVELKNLLNSGLIIALSKLDENLLIQNYKFAHDRIQQAAYVLADEKEKQSIHLKIGRLLLQDKTEEELGEQIFAIIEQLNRGINLIEDVLEKTLLAILNLTAAEKAKAATAYEAAREYLKIAHELLPSDSWQTDYELTLNIYTKTVEVAYLRGDFACMEQMAEIVLAQTSNLLDKVRVYEIQIEAYIAQNQNLEAIQTALPILQLLGVILPTNPTESDVKAEFQQTQSNLQAHAIANLSNLPVMSDRSTLAAVAIMKSIVPSAYIAAPTLFPLIIFKQINLFLNYGNTSLSAVAYVFYGLIVCSMADDIGQGYSFGQLALEISERFGAQELYANIVAVLYATIQHWKESLRKSLEPLKFSYQRGLETGDLYHGTTSSYLYAFHAVFSGQELTTLASEVQGYNDACRKFKQDITLNYNQIYAQLIFNLVEIKEKPDLLRGKAYDEEKMLPFHLQANDRYALCALYVNKLYLALLFGETKNAVDQANQAINYLDGATSTLLFPLFYFYDSLAQLAIYEFSCQLQQEQIRERVRLNQSKMEHWSKYAPMNYLHKFHLVAAEWHRVQGDYLQAIDCYELAIAKAQEQQFLNDEALATELAGKFYLAWGKQKIAQTYLNDAYYIYLHWGAKAKAKHLVQTYGRFITRASPTTTGTYVPEQITVGFDVTTDSESRYSLDLATVMKASQAISEEILLEKLLANLMKILIENAGAESGYLILNSDAGLHIEAEGYFNSSTINVLQSIPLEDNLLLPFCLIQYVARTLENVVLSNASLEGNFIHDFYIQSIEAKSILCFPILTQGQLVGIVYLENNLVTGAFSPDRLEVLNVLSAQAAISIQNARLYQTLEDKVTERTAQLASANQEISTLNAKLKRENLRMGSELDVARQIQQMVLPKPEELEAIEGIDLIGYMASAYEVGGDYYDVLQSDGLITIGIGDVTGHGLESGIVMLMTQTAVRTLQEMKESDPIRFLDTLNRTIYHNVKRMNSDKNLTLGLIHYFQGKVIISGQHEETLLVRGLGYIERIDTMDLGLPIGMDDDIADFIDYTIVELEPGDGLVLYTDGITEAFNLEKEQYGMDRLCQVISQNWQLTAEEIKQAIIDDVQTFIGEQKVFDDMTLVILKQH